MMNPARPGAVTTRQRTPLAAAILAGGRASRLGGINKGTLTVGALPIIDRQLETLRQVASHLFVVGRDDAVWTARQLTVVHDAVPGAGPLGGIYTAVLHSPCERTLVVACDMPFLSVDLLHRMAAVDGADVVIPRSSRGREPLCAIYARTCAADIAARLAEGKYEASTLPAGARIAELAVEDDHGFMNVNTPHDHERAKDYAEWKPEPTGMVSRLREPFPTDER